MDSNSESVWYGAPPAPETMSAPEPQHEDERHVRLRTDARYFLLLSLAPNNVTFILAAILAGYGFGGLEPALQSMAVHSSSPAERGSANSTFLCAYDIGIGLGGGIAGWLITAAGYENMFLVLSAANIISVLMYVFWGRHNPSSLSYSLRQAQKNEVK